MKILLALAFLKLASCTLSHGNYLPPTNRGFSGSSFSSGSSFGGSSFSGSQSGAYSGSFSGSGQQIPIVRLDAKNEGDGSYQYNYETGNGISAQEHGEAGGDGTRAQGGFSYTAPDGQQIRVTYVADENGFRPEGSFKSIELEPTGLKLVGNCTLWVTGIKGVEGNNKAEAKIIFKWTGAHLPTPPPIPEAILKSIQQNLADEARGVSDDGSYRESQGGGGGHFGGGSSFGGSSFGRGGQGGGYNY